jgi:hypothetical protein
MMHAIQSEHESALTGHRFFLLFLLLLGTLILYPYADTSRFGHYAFRVIGSAATLISVYAAKIHRTLLVFALILAIPTLFQRILVPKADASSFSIFNIVLSFVFDVLIIVVIFRHSPRNRPTRKPSLEPSVSTCWWGSVLPVPTAWLPPSSHMPFISTRTPTFTSFPTASISFITVSAP